MYTHYSQYTVYLLARGYIYPGLVTCRQLVVRVTCPHMVSAMHEHLSWEVASSSPGAQYEFRRCLHFVRQAILLLHSMMRCYTARCAALVVLLLRRLGDVVPHARLVRVRLRRRPIACAPPLAPPWRLQPTRDVVAAAQRMRVHVCAIDSANKQTIVSAQIKAPTGKGHTDPAAELHPSFRLKSGSTI